MSVVDKWALGPDVSRVGVIDERLRCRLADSLSYVAEMAGSDSLGQEQLDSLLQRLREASVSPWMFCLYSELVAELVKKPRGDVKRCFNEVAVAAALQSEPSVVALGDPGIDEAWWRHFGVLLDTDPQQPFDPQPPEFRAFASCKQDIRLGFELLRRGDADFHTEVCRLLRMIVLGAPAPGSRGFNGASTFFLWGATLLNANTKRSPVSLIDLVIHESSHVLLFGIAAEGPLLHNSSQERYASPLRPDKRPIDGIFHACFVTTRVHLAMQRLLGSDAIRGDDAKEAAERGIRNGRASLASLELLECHAVPTDLGARILGVISAYWADASNRSSVA